MSSLPVREAARAVVLDADLRVLLLRYPENGGFWATAGGSLEPDEDYPAAVLRELREEVGAEKVDLDGQIAERVQEHPVSGQQVRQVERYFLVHASADGIDPSRASQPDTIRSSRWWTLAELHSSTETVDPLGLAELLAHGTPRSPVILH
ncbi:NUDIX domain-containing protein [Streptomyces sp. S1D4-20]|uniref:NUDIX hydrolase n=1 Tax=Streptomyces sp. S1D4-20 TaxID=2594462 RepID=UPI0011657E63|nr:NUDIX domain-containing protein [Streptomyces sp. S1D4-20]QDN54185.1 NUDIX domain-containing protein [Streptomyces sp. S1D4-20]